MNREKRKLIRILQDTSICRTNSREEPRNRWPLFLVKREDVERQRMRETA